MYYPKINWRWWFSITDNWNVRQLVWTPVWTIQKKYEKDVAKRVKLEKERKDLYIAVKLLQDNPVKIEKYQEYAQWIGTIQELQVLIDKCEHELSELDKYFILKWI